MRYTMEKQKLKRINGNIHNINATMFEILNNIVIVLHGMPVLNLGWGLKVTLPNHHPLIENFIWYVNITSQNIR
jgi:hypothetical protein